MCFYRIYNFQNDQYITSRVKNVLLNGHSCEYFFNTPYERYPQTLYQITAIEMLSKYGFSNNLTCSIV